MVIYFLSVIPMIYLGLYTYPQADDFCQSAGTHNIWTTTHSLVEVFRYSINNGIDGWKTWGGGFSSGFFCALQPDVFVNRGYSIVPFLSIFLLSWATWIFVNAIMLNIFKSNASLSRTVSCFIMMYIIWNIPSACQAFYWYQGSAHYILPFSMLLITFALAITGLKSKYNYLFCIFSSITGVMVGGANLVSALLMALLYLLFGIYCIVMSQKKMIIWVVPSFVFYFCFFMNIVAPGNKARQSMMELGPDNPIRTIVNSFGYAIHYCFSEWMNIFVIMLLVILIPIIWRGLEGCEFSFKYPALVLFMTFCLVSAMYAPTAYATRSAGPSRVRNIIFSFYIISLVLDEVYVIGWIRKKGFTTNIKYSMGYYIGLCVIFIMFFGFVFYRYNDKYCNVLTAMSIIKNGKAIEYAKLIDYNMKQLNSDDMTVTIHKVVDGPYFFYSPEISDWKEGTKAYFNKDLILYDE